jgi:F-type H+-transporting ATPase subunit a
MASGGDISSVGQGPRIIVSFDNGVYITETVFFAVIVAVVLAVVLVWMASSLTKQPSGKQVIAEAIVEMIYGMTTKTMGKSNINFAPYIGTLFIFLITGSALGIFGFRAVTADMNMTFALAFITCFLINYNSIRSLGFKGKLKHMCEPYPFMFPLKIIEIISQPLSIGFRLFGNIFGGCVVMGLLFVALTSISTSIGLHIPIFTAALPLPAMAFFDAFHPFIQAYIFTMLTMVFISMEIVRHGDEGHH